jgi:PAS domain S-box-containing protein
MSDTSNGGRERAYRALAESEELHRATLSSISDAVFLTDDEGLFTFICPNVDVIFGYVPDEVQAMGRIDNLLGEQLFDRAELAARGEITNIEREITSKSGLRRWLLIHIKRVAIQHSTILYTCRDVTERKHAEDELRAARLDLAHASRLGLVGQLVASISHEINQPLTAIKTNASVGLRLMAQNPGPDVLQELREIFTDIHDQSRRADEIMARVRALARRRPLLRQALDVNEVAGDMVRLVGTEARRRGVKLRTELGTSLPTIAADRVSLQQVMLNLIVNAMDAMDELEMEDRSVVVRTRRLEGGVEVEVSDVGHGIPPECLTKLFDAFFTTKKDGLGLGLAIVRSIVEAHQGRIWAEDHSGPGVTFHVALPVAGAMAS